MARIALAAIAGFIIVIATFGSDFAAAMSIRSKTASGNGCPLEHLVTSTIRLKARGSDSTVLNISYLDLGPEVHTTNDQAVKSCRVFLEMDLEDQPPVGRRYSIARIFRYAHFYTSQVASGEGDWEFNFSTDVQLENGPVASVSRKPRARPVRESNADTA